MEDEQADNFKICAAAEEGDSVNEDVDEIEYASDDDDEESKEGVKTRAQRKRGNQNDEEFLMDAEDDVNDSEEGAMDELEAEAVEMDDDEQAAHKKAKKERTVYRRHRSDVEEANLEGEEQVETLFIDNLPNDE